MTLTVARFAKVTAPVPLLSQILWRAVVPFNPLLIADARLWSKKNLWINDTDTSNIFFYRNRIFSIIIKLLYYFRLCSLVLLLNLIMKKWINYIVYEISSSPKSQRCKRDFGSSSEWHIGSSEWVAG